jgi:hypothetical protein
MLVGIKAVNFYFYFYYYYYYYLVQLKPKSTNKISYLEKKKKKSKSCWMLGLSYAILLYCTTRVCDLVLFFPENSLSQECPSMLNVSFFFFFFFKKKILYRFGAEIIHSFQTEDVAHIIELENDFAITNGMHHRIINVFIKWIINYNSQITMANQSSPPFFSIVLSIKWMGIKSFSKKNKRLE